MTNLICSLLILFGSLLSLTAAIGMLRMPDLLMRMHAGTKAGTLGVSLILTAIAIHFAMISVAIKVIIIIGFLFLTIPIGAHMLGRAAYIIQVPLWEKTCKDDLKYFYEQESKKSEKDKQSQDNE